MSDIKLVEDQVVVEGTLEVQGPDIKLAIAERKSSANREPYRRALVHGFQDQLVINYKNDYLGVVINGTGSEGINLNGDVFINAINIVEIINGLQTTVERLIEDKNTLMENQDVMEERIKTLEIKAGIRPHELSQHILSNLPEDIFAPQVNLPEDFVNPQLNIPIEALINSEEDSDES